VGDARRRAHPEPVVPASTSFARAERRRPAERLAGGVPGFGGSRPSNSSTPPRSTTASPGRASRGRRPASSAGTQLASSRSELAGAAAAARRRSRRSSAAGPGHGPAGTPEVQRYAPRTLDIDILFYGDQVLRRGRRPPGPANAPPPSAASSRPAADLAPELEHPASIAPSESCSRSSRHEHDVRAGDLSGALVRGSERIRGLRRIVQRLALRRRWTPLTTSPCT